MVPECGAAESRGPSFCDTPARGVMWRHADGSYSPVRCGRSNSCAYCAWLTTAENMLVVALDARERMPRHGITLTTRDPDFDQARFRVVVAQWIRWLRKEFPVQYLALMEWTSGKSATSGGCRRMHQHTLVKGIPDDADLDQVWREGKRRWEKLTGAHRIEVRELRKPAGAIAYLVAHHNKTEQAPPDGWSGKRFRPSKGYFTRPVPQLREQVRMTRSRAVAMYKLTSQLAEQDLDLSDFGEDVLEQLLAGASTPPELVQVKQLPRGSLWDNTNGGVIKLQRARNPPRRPVQAA